MCLSPIQQLKSIERRVSNLT